MKRIGLDIAQVGLVLGSGAASLFWSGNIPLTVIITTAAGTVAIAIDSHCAKISENQICNLEDRSTELTEKLNALEAEEKENDAQILEMQEKLKAIEAEYKRLNQRKP